MLFAASCVLCRVQLDLWVPRFPWYTVGWKLGAIVAEGLGSGWERHTSQPQDNLSSGVEPRQEAMPTAAHRVTREGGESSEREGGEEAQGSPGGRSLGGQACHLHQLVLS